MFMVTNDPDVAMERLCLWAKHFHAEKFLSLSNDKNCLQLAVGQIQLMYVVSIFLILSFFAPSLFEFYSKWKEKRNKTISLYNAAQIALNKLEDSHGEIVRGNSTTESDILEWFCNLIEMNGVKIIGKLSPSNESQVFYRKVDGKPQYYFHVEGDEIVATSKDLPSRWENLTVKNSDLLKTIRKIKKNSA